MAKARVPIHNISETWTIFPPDTGR